MPPKSKRGAVTCSSWYQLRVSANTVQLTRGKPSTSSRVAFCRGIGMLVWTAILLLSVVEEIQDASVPDSTTSLHTHPSGGWDTHRILFIPSPVVWEFSVTQQLILGPFAWEVSVSQQCICDIRRERSQLPHNPNSHYEAPDSSPEPPTSLNQDVLSRDISVRGTCNAPFPTTHMRQSVLIFAEVFTDDAPSLPPLNSSHQASLRPPTFGQRRATSESLSEHHEYSRLQQSPSPRFFTHWKRPHFVRSRV